MICTDVTSNNLVSYCMSITLNSLTARQTDLTQRLILDAALQHLSEEPGEALAVRAVARRAQISERTVFRYFASRDELLNAVAAEYARRLALPPEPTTLEELLAYPAALYARFEETSALTKAALHSELYDRVRTTDAQTRRAAIGTLVDRLAPDRPEEERRIAAANIHYHLIASTWHYYCIYFGFPLDEAVQCARTVIVQALRGLFVKNV